MRTHPTGSREEGKAMELKFTVREGRKNKNAAEMKYDYACGCHPIARYIRDDSRAGSQHCCCGIVHFVGSGAQAQLHRCLESRKAQSLDELVNGHKFRQTALKALWGAEIEVAYARSSSR